jgi:putative SOS response-associated peptidase YedK
MCNLYSITTNQAAIIALFRVINRYVGNLPPMPGVFPDYPAPVIRNSESGTELVTMRWGMPPPPRSPWPPVTNIRNMSSPASGRCSTVTEARSPSRHRDHTKSTAS